MKVDIVVLLSLIAAIVGMVIGWLGHSRTIKSDIKADATERATMATDIKYIKDKMSELVTGYKSTEKELVNLDKRVTGMEQTLNEGIVPRLDKLEKQVTNQSKTNPTYA